MLRSLMMVGMFESQAGISNESVNISLTRFFSPGVSLKAIYIRVTPNTPENYSVYAELSFQSIFE